MDTKFVIFAAISTLLVAAIYGSSTSVVFAAVSCLDFDKNTKVCVTDTSTDLYECVKQDDGKWVCTKLPPSSVPPGLAGALEDATGPAGPLKEGGVLEEPESDQPESNNTFTRANISALE